MTKCQGTILIVDDDKDTRVILKTILEDNGFAVLVAKGPTHAITLVQENAIDLIILNYPMQTTEGTLTQKLRALPQTSQIPIINFTSHVVPQIIDRAASHGVSATVPKPAHVDEILRLVRRFTEATS